MMGKRSNAANCVADGAVKKAKSQCPDVTDHYKSHFCTDLEESVAEQLLTTSLPSVSFELDALGQCLVALPPAQVDLQGLEIASGSFIPGCIAKNLRANADAFVKKDANREFLSIATRYLDVLLPSAGRSDECRPLYCLHALNHALKTRKLIVQNNEKLRSLKESGRLADADLDKFRDQGLARPKILILCPFKKTAKEIVDCMTDFLFGSDAKTFVTNRSRFEKEYGGQDNDVSHRTDVDDDYRQLMTGNIEDGFRIGLGIGKKSLKLYTDFYQSDILLASPLGLRMAVGDESERDHEHDFLASIEVLIMDRADIFLMQNWQHVLHIMQNMHVQPKEAHGVDLTRTRNWSLNGWARLYRQTIVLSDVAAPEIRALFSKYCSNYQGSLQFHPHIGTNGALDGVHLYLPHAYHRFCSLDPVTDAEKRFDYFIKKVLPQFKDGGGLTRTLLFIPSYFDFVRIRNHLKKEGASFVQVSEYAEHKKVARARGMFYHGDKSMLLLTERAHFYKRYRIKGACHVIFYQLPTYPKFYAEVCNFLREPLPKRGAKTANSTPVGCGDGIRTCSVLYSKFDAIRLANVLGREGAGRLIKSQKDMHMIVTDKEDD